MPKILVVKKKIWNLSLNKWDILENKFSPGYSFGLKSNGTANFEVIDGSLLLNSKGSGWFSIVHDPWRPCNGDGGHLGQNPGIFNRNNIDKRLREFKNKIKTKFEVISVFSDQDIKKVKKILIKNVN